MEVALKDLPGNWGSQARRGLPRVSVQQMFQAMAGALGQVSKRVAQIRGLPTLQQLLLCCLVVARAQLATRVSGPLPWKTVRAHTQIGKRKSGGHTTHHRHSWHSCHV